MNFSAAKEKLENCMTAMLNDMSILSLRYAIVLSKNLDIEGQYKAFNGMIQNFTK